MDIYHGPKSTPGDAERRARIDADARAALRRIKSEQTYEDWRAIGQQLLVITEDTLPDLKLDAWDPDNRRLARMFTARFEKWEREASAGSNAKPLTKQERWALRELMTNREVHGWYMTLSGFERRKLNHPNAIINKYKRTHPPEPKQETEAQAPKPKTPKMHVEHAIDAPRDYVDGRDFATDERMALAKRLGLTPLRSDLTVQAVRHWLNEMESELRRETIGQLVSPFNFKLVQFVKPGADDVLVYCTMCGKGKVKVMVQDSDTGIALCDECVDLCAKKIAEAGATQTVAGGASRPNRAR
jgi:hypothetical protein